MKIANKSVMMKAAIIIPRTNVCVCFFCPVPHFLQSKVQKQQAFDAEILANRSQIESVSSTAHELRNAGHYAADHIAESVESLADMYAALCEASKVRHTRNAFHSAHCSVRGGGGGWGMMSHSGECGKLSRYVCSAV